MTFPSFIRALSFPLAGRRDRYLFSDAFITDDGDGRRLVLVSTYYPDVTFDFGAVVVTVDGSRRAAREIGVNAYEPSRAVVYALGDLPARAVHAVDISYEGQHLSARIAPDVAPPRPEFALATQFKGDHRNVEAMYRYYRSQGFERFYLFYNGDLARLASPLFKAPGIIYGEWNFRYRLYAHEPPFNALLVDPGALQNHHHAQAMFLTMARFRLLRRSSFLALVDLDEFVAMPDRSETVRAHVERVNATHLTAPCHWAEVRAPAGTELTTSPLVRKACRRLASIAKRVAKRVGIVAPEPVIAHSDLAHIYANPAATNGRGKTIYRGDYDGLFGVHYPKTASTSWNPSPDLLFYHLVNTTHARFDLISADATPVALV